MVSSRRNDGTITQELRYPFAGTVVQFRQESSHTVPQSIQYNSEEPHFPQLRSSQLRIFMGEKYGTSLKNYTTGEPQLQ